jgi:hypothetical protein
VFALEQSCAHARWLAGDRKNLPEDTMKATLILATVIAAAALAGPAAAQGVYIGGRDGGVGVGVDVGPRHHYREREVYTSGYNRSYERCRTTVIRHSDGSVRKIKRCRD